MGPLLERVSWSKPTLGYRTPRAPCDTPVTLASPAPQPTRRAPGEKTSLGPGSARLRLTWARRKFLPSSVSGSVGRKIDYSCRMSAKERIRSLLRSRGVEVGGYRYTVDARRQQMLDYYGIRTLVDVGANVGQYARTVRRAGYHEKIVSFEPASSAFSELAARTAKDPLWHSHQIAVGSSNGSLMMNLSEGSIFNSPLNISQGGVSASPNAKIVGTEEVLVRTLDDLLESLSVTLPLAVKVDVQGFEREVLEGARETLQSAQLIELELSPTPIYDGQMILQEALDRMSSAGFVLSLTENLLPQPDTGRALQFNGIFVRPN